jgi:hypothetical protein
MKAVTRVVIVLLLVVVAFGVSAMLGVNPFVGGGQITDLITEVSPPTCTSGPSPRADC